MENIENKKPKIVATIMQKHYIGENSFVYNPINIIEGEVDTDSKVFIDVNGNEYLNMLDPILAYSEQPYAYFNAIDYDKFRERFPENMTPEEILKCYQDSCDSIFYYVSNKNGDMFNVQFNKDDFIELYDTFKLKDSDVKSIFLNFGEGKKNLFQGDPELNELDFSDDIEFGPSDDDYYDDEEEEDVEFTKTVTDILSGTKSLEELKALRNDIIEAKGKTEELLNILNEQIGEEKEEKPKRLNIEELYKKITKTLIGQDEQVKRLVTEVDRMNRAKQIKQGILITGATGTGKTKSIELLAKYLDRPLLIVDSTSITAPGYVGKDIEEVLWDLYIKSKKDIKKAESAVVYFDEIDKKGSERKSDVSGQAVLNVLLKFLDGTTYEATPNTQLKKEVAKINTKDMIVIGGGCFNDVYSNIKNNKPMGFGARQQEEKPKEPTLNDFVENGMMTKEFMGRMPVIIHMNDWTTEKLKEYLKVSDESPLIFHKNIFEEQNVEFHPTDAYLEKICENSLKKELGARGIAGQLLNDTAEAYYEVVNSPDKYKEFILDYQDNEIKTQLVEKNKELIPNTTKKEKVLKY